MVLIGIVLLLPGLCAVIYGFVIVANIAEFRAMVGILPLVFLGLLAGAAGIGLIVLAFRR
jgi:hypothetical protein